jgi:hypothetical protein
VLTNSPEGRSKKEQLLEYFRCGDDRPFSSWDNKEILQPILSGVVLVYTWWSSVSRTPDPLQPTLTGYGAIDALMSATMTMMAAESLGLKTSFLVCIKDKLQANLEIASNPEEHIVAVVTVANEDLGALRDESMINHIYKEQNAHIYLKKHHNIASTVKIQTI